MYILGPRNPKVPIKPTRSRKTLADYSWVDCRLLDATHGHDFVMSSILSFSATHIAWLTKSVETKNLAYFHAGIALKGLHQAIGKFSKDNSDAVLAASILLAWQASDW